MTESAKSANKSARNDRDASQAQGADAKRRKLLTTIAVGGSFTSLAVLPDRWVRPVVDTVMLPAHAQTSPGTIDPPAGGSSSSSSSSGSGSGSSSGGSSSSGSSSSGSQPPPE